MQPTNNYKIVSLILAIVLLSVSIYLLVPGKKESITEKVSFFSKDAFKGINVPSFEVETTKQGGLISRGMASQMIGAYRFFIKHPSDLVLTSGLWHDPSSLADYINTTYPNFKAANTDVLASHPGYDWQIGFYYAVSFVNGSDSAKLSLCIVPTLVNENLPVTDTTRILDFHRHVNDATIYKNLGIPKTDPKKHMKKEDCLDCFIYDTGEIWP